MEKEFSKIVLIKDTKIDELNLLLSLDCDKFEKEVLIGNIKEDETVFSHTIKFENGYFVDIKVCTGQNNAYSDFILFDPNGNEITNCVGDDDAIDGEVFFELEEENLRFNILVEAV